VSSSGIKQKSNKSKLSRSSPKSKSSSKKTTSEGRPKRKITRAAPRRPTARMDGSIWRKSIWEVGATMLEQEMQEAKTREEKGLPKGPRRSKRQRFKPQFHERAVRELDEVTGCDRYKKDNDGNIIFECIHHRTLPKRNKKRKQKQDKRKKKRRRFQVEEDEEDGTNTDDEPGNRKVDLDKVTPINKEVWAYAEDDPSEEQKN